MYRLHSMHGPTVFASESLTEALNCLLRKALSNGGMYRVVDERNQREVAMLDTNAIYWPLCYERNRGAQPLSEIRSF